jgi:hypothetical protein
LETDPDPIDRHFQFAELESRLYRCRDLFPEALDEFDEACQRHDAEMHTICEAFRAKWAKLPLLETYKQMAIRQQKRKDWQACLWWAERRPRALRQRRRTRGRRRGPSQAPKPSVVQARRGVPPTVATSVTPSSGGVDRSTRVCRVRQELRASPHPRPEANRLPRVPRELTTEVGAEQPWTDPGTDQDDGTAEPRIDRGHPIVGTSTAASVALIR